MAGVRLVKGLVESITREQHTENPTSVSLLICGKGGVVKGWNEALLLHSQWSLGVWRGEGVKRAPSTGP